MNPETLFRDRGTTCRDRRNENKEDKPDAGTRTPRFTGGVRGKTPD